MADETSSIALQLNVQLRGLVNLTKLNTALVDLKRNARGFQNDLSKGTTALGSIGNKAKEAAAGLTALTKANKDLAAASKQVSGGTNIGKNMQNQFAGFSKTARANEQAAAQAAKASVRARTQAEQMYARMFDQLENKRLAKSTATERQRVAVNAAAMRAIEQAARRRHAIEESLAAKTLALSHRQIRADRDRADMMTSLTGRLRVFEQENDAGFRAGFRLQMLGNDMEAAGRKTVGALKAMADEFGTFEFMVNRAAGATGIATTEMDGSINVYNSFKDAILSASQELRLFKPEEVAKATYFWASTTGQQVDTLEDLESVMQSINPLMKIAAMTETSYETAIKGVYGILTQYGMGLEKVQEVTEKLHLTTQRTAAEFPDLINSFKMVGPVAREFGVSFEEMVLLLGRLADAGIRGTMSGRAFRQFFIQISKPSKPATKALNDLWESTEKFGNKSYIETVFPKGEFIGVNEYVEELAMRLQGATTKQRMFTLASITTANELPVLTALVSKQIAVLDRVSDGWDGTKESQKDAAQAFADSWALLSNSWKGTVGALTVGVEILRIKVGERIAKIFTPVLNQVTEKLIVLRKWFSDESNGPIIDFFIKLAGAAGVLLAVGGAATVLVGVLIAMAHAARVAFGAFGPLFKVFGLLGGTVGVFAIALVRNFEYIKGVVTEVAKNIDEALKENSDTVDALGVAVSGFAAIVGPAFDIIIRIFGELAIVLSKVIAWILKSEGAMNLLAIAGQFLGVILAVKMLAGIKSLTTGFLVGTKAMAGFRTVLLATNIAAASGGLMNLAKGGLLSSLKGLVPLIGTGGIIAAGVAAVAAAFVVAYTNVDSFKGAVDRLVFSAITGLGELTEAADAARAALGQWAPEVDEAMNLDPVVMGLRADVERIQGELVGLTDIPFTELDTFSVLTNELNQTSKLLKQEETNIYTTYQSWLKDLNDAGANIDMGTMLSRLNFEANSLNTTFSDTRARRAMNGYFMTVTAGAKSADEQAAQLIKTMNSPQTMGPQAVFDAPKKLVLAKLIDLQAGGKLSSEAALEVTQAIESGMAEGLLNTDPPPTEYTAKVWGGIANSLIESGKAVFDFGSVMKKVLDESMNPKTIVKHLRDHTTKFLKGGLGKPTAEGWAQLGAFWQSIEERNQELALLMTPAEFKGYATQTINGLMKDFKDGFPSEMPEPIRQTFRDLIISLYNQLSLPIPQNIIDTLGIRGSEVGGVFIASLGSPENQTNANAAAGDVLAAAESGFVPNTSPHIAGSYMTSTFLDGYKSWTAPLSRAGVGIQSAAEAGFVAKTSPYAAGSYMTSTFRDGYASWTKSISNAANTIGNSVLKMNKNGPYAWGWGNDLGQNMASGLNSTFRVVEGAALNIGRAIYGSLHQSVADYGPLKDTDVWGVHLGQNIADGMNKSVGDVKSAALNVANAAAMANTYAQDAIGAGNVNVEAASNRTIKVQVEVTSPDGSVDRLKAAELERGIMTNDLILSIEHMSVVG